jgi:hypothetical protein
MINMMTLRFQAVALLTGLLFASCAPKNASHSRNYLVTEDFAISQLTQDQVTSLLSQQSSSSSDCIAHIRAVTCVSQQAELGFDTKCSSATLDPSIFDHLPELLVMLPPLQKQVLCHLDRLQLQPKIYSVGYATQITDSQNKTVGNMVGIRPEAFRGDPIPYDIFSWKEQLSFGLSKMNDPTYSVSELGPRIVESINGQPNSLVVHVLVHELSHLVDFMNKANAADDCQWANATQTSRPRRVACTISNPTSFEALSWTHQYSYKEDYSDYPPKEWKAKYPLLSEICYYKCSTPTPLSAMEAVYKNLGESSFVTAYASNNNLEDFAESSTVFLLKDKGFGYKVVGPDGQTLFDLDQHWASGILDKKKQWLKSFYSRADLKYKVGSSK